MCKQAPKVYTIIRLSKVAPLISIQRFHAGVSMTDVILRVYSVTVAAAYTISIFYRIEFSKKETFFGT